MSKNPFEVPPPERHPIGRDVPHPRPGDVQIADASAPGGWRWGPDPNRVFVTPVPEGYTPIVTIHLPMDASVFIDIQNAIERHYPNAVIRAGNDPHLMTIYDKPR